MKLNLYNQIHDYFLRDVTRLHFLKHALLLSPLEHNWHYYNIFIHFIQNMLPPFEHSNQTQHKKEKWDPVMTSDVVLNKVWDKY